MRTIPTINIPEIFHIGSMQASDKGDSSYEGSGLSVSPYPDEWTKIARLSGSLFKISKDGGIAFVDHNSVIHDSDTMSEIINVALAEDILVKAPVFYFEYCDGDTEVEQCFDDEADAITEAEGMYKVLKRDGYRCTDKAAAFMCRKSISVCEAETVAILYFSETKTNFDGVYWDDEYDPYALSAPRGVIFKKSLRDMFVSMAEDKSKIRHYHF